MIQGLHTAVVGMGMLMMDLAVALVLVVLTAGQAVSMVVGEALMVAMEVNLLGMGDMLELWEDPTEEILP
jgi:hypothetical protein